LKKITHHNAIKYKIPGHIIKDDKYKITSRREILDKIENQLIKADFARNRDYLTWALPSSEISITDIIPDYNVPIDNHWGDIPEGFCEIKQNAANALTEIEKVGFVLKSIAEEIDPEKVVEYLDDFRYHCRGGDGNWHISFQDNIYDQDFIEVIKKHQEIIQELKKHKVLDRYLLAQKKIENSFNEFLCRELPFDNSLTHQAAIEFDMKNWNIGSITNKLINVPTDSGETSNNELRYHWKPLMTTYGCKRYNDNSDKIRNNCKYVSSECMRKIMNQCLSTNY